MRGDDGGRRSAIGRYEGPKLRNRRRLLAGQIQRPVHSVHERLACEGGRSRKRKPVRNGQISGLSDRLHHPVRQVGVPMQMEERGKL